MPEKARGTVIFDLAGTLVDGAPDPADALDLLLMDRGHSALGLDAVRGLIGHGVAEWVRKGVAQVGDNPRAGSGRTWACSRLCLGGGAGSSWHGKTGSGASSALPARQQPCVLSRNGRGRSRDRCGGRTGGGFAYRKRPA